jgi:hypothetical protein
MLNRFRLRILGTIFVTLLLPVSAARAAWITVDSSQGAGTAVLDTSSGTEWLKLSVTENWTFAQVEAAIAPGGALQDFRYATGAELNCGLLPAYFNLNTQCAGNFGTLGDAATVNVFFDLLGFTGQRYHEAYYALLPPDRPDGRDAFVSQFFLYDEPSPHYEYDSQRVPVDMNRSERHWLVAKGQDLPEPHIALLFGLGAIGFAAAGRSRARSKR